MKSFLKTALLFVLIASSSHAQNQTSDLKEFEESFKAFISNKMKKHNVVGASVTFVADNEVVVNEGFGFSDKTGEIRTNENTTYPIGSVSKIVTSTAVLKLYSDGLIDIDKPYTAYVPDFKIKSHFDGPPSFTVRHLLSHYSGLPRLIAKGFLKKEQEPLETILTYSEDEYLASSAGKSYQYSDWGVDLLAVLVQRVSGTTFENYVKTAVFEPLGMEHSYFGKTPTKGYINNNETETYEFSYSGSDGVISTPSDLSKLCSVYFKSSTLAEDAFLKHEVVTDALTRQFTDAPLSYDTEIGLMWEIKQLNGFKRVKKAGIHEPFYTYIFFIPEYNSSIVICSNSNSSSKLHWDAWSKAYSFMGKKFKLDRSPNPIHKKRKAKKVKLPQEQMKKLEGVYNTGIGMLKLQANGEKFDAELLSEGLKGTGIPYSENLIKLYVKKLGIKIHAMDIFWDEIAGEVVVGEQYKSGRRLIGGAKIGDNPIPESWKNAIGQYEVSKYGDNEYRTFEHITVSMNKSGILQLNAKVGYPSEMEFALGLRPLSDEMAIIPGYNFEFFAGETIQLLNRRGRPQLKFSGYIFEKKN
ncbi:serine hydrolase domain-containing protein [Flagellimonas nanhaiensis]|uniref:Class A beta-lactamase-related serine hydrolase n=1 Tax=Flagellimonas nanhaiensis TaxID=2292706 RepID=A0A371JR54_9FLAO|nr:serine hydrolase domain-containing protein [Allomuricauda nanhaiensis]RDY59975.1 class A beta-lactamase-related serine hydrolase [Allomuricauda nanhaiensis]